MLDLKLIYFKDCKFVISLHPYLIVFLMLHKQRTLPLCHKAKPTR